MEWGLVGPVYMFGVFCFFRRPKHTKSVMGPASRLLAVLVFLGLGVLAVLLLWLSVNDAQQKAKANVAPATVTATVFPGPPRRTRVAVANRPASFLRNLPDLDTAVAIWFNATCPENLVGAGLHGSDLPLAEGAAVRAWAPMLGTPWAGSPGDTLVAASFDDATCPRVHYPQPQKPGVRVMPGGLLGTRTPASVPLFGRCVFVVCTLRPSTITAFATVLTDRGAPDGPVGSVILRADGARMAVYLRRSDRWFGSLWAGDLPGDRPRVWGFQYTEDGGDVLLRCVPNQTTLGTAAVGAQVMPNVSGAPDAPYGELQVGGWRNSGALETDGGTEAGDCTVHEVVVFEDALSDADMLAVYASLVLMWQ